MAHLTLGGLARFALLCLAISLTGTAASEIERIPTAAAMGLAVLKPPPETPGIARQLKIVGTVELDVTIDEGGAVESVAVLRGNPILGRAAQASAKKWKFRPYKQGDTAIKVIATLRFDFK
jgi:TonB family protein